MADLKRCPFCVGAVRLHCNQNETPAAKHAEHFRWWIRCEGCNLLTRPFKSEKEAVEYWQRRSTE